MSSSSHERISISVSSFSSLSILVQAVFVDAIHPQSGGMTIWYFVLTTSLLYNAYVIPLRVSFTPYQHQERLSGRLFIKGMVLNKTVQSFLLLISLH